MAFSYCFRRPQQRIQTFGLEDLQETVDLVKQPGAAGDFAIRFLHLPVLFGVLLRLQLYLCWNLRGFRARRSAESIAGEEEGVETSEG